MGLSRVSRFGAKSAGEPPAAARSFAIDVTESKAVPAFCLSIHASYRCQHAGACCTAGWPIPAEPPLVATLERGGLGQAWTAVRAFGEQPGPDGPVRVLRTHADAACVFYERERHRCAVHRLAGPQVLPVACRNFPRITLTDRRGTFITLSHFCPTAASLLQTDAPLAIVEAPASLSLDGGVEGLDATGVLPPLLRPGMLMDAGGYTAWEEEAIEVLDNRRYSARAALGIIAAATREIRSWEPGGDTLEARVRDRFEHQRRRVSPAWPSPPPQEAPIKAFLAAHLFASWHGYQDGGLDAIVHGVDAALATLTRELSRSSFVPAVRAADFHLRHSRADVGPGSLSSLRRH